MRLDIYEIIQKMKKEDPNVKINLVAFAKEHNCDVRTVAKYLQDKAVFKKVRRRRKKLIDVWAETIEKKYYSEHPTAKAIFRYLCTIGYESSYASVRDYVHILKVKEKQAQEEELSKPVK